MDKQKIYSLFLLIFFCLPAHAERPLVVTTTGIVADLVSSIGGDHFEIQSLMGPGVDPHLYRATPGDLQALRKANLVLFNGLHLEGKMQDILDKLGKEKRVVAITDRISRTELRAPPEFEGNFDPHIWFDALLWKSCAEVVRDELVSLAPNKRELLSQNHEKYSKELAALHQDLSSAILAIPQSRRVLITAHDAFAYFGRAYGIEVMALQGISTATEYGLRDVSRLVDFIVKRSIPAIFVESSVSHKFVAAIQEGVEAKGAKVKLGGELFSDALGPTGSVEGTYIGMMRHNAHIITEALK